VWTMKQCSQRDPMGHCAEGTGWQALRATLETLAERWTATSAGTSPPEAPRPDPPLLFTDTPPRASTWTSSFGASPSGGHRPVARAVFAALRVALPQRLHRYDPELSKDFAPLSSQCKHGCRELPRSRGPQPALDRADAQGPPKSCCDARRADRPSEVDAPGPAACELHPPLKEGRRPATLGLARCRPKPSSAASPNGKEWRQRPPWHTSGPCSPRCGRPAV